MKNTKSAIAMLVAIAMTASLAGCGSSNGSSGGNTGSSGGNDGGTTQAASNDSGDKKDDSNAGGGDAASDGGAAASSGEIKEFTAFYAVPGTEIDEDNMTKNLIAEKIGAKCKETYLVGQTADEAIGGMIALGEFPDFVDASTGMSSMVDAGAFIPIDEYWDNYPNIKNLWSEAEWNQVRNADGHIYIMPQFGNVNGYDTETTHWGEAWWIQVRVLEWAGYPKITTMDEYFNLIEDYIAANPTMDDGTPNIGYEILCEDWRYFCLENAPFFLDGYPNDGCVIVDKDTKKAIDYNTTPTAERYFAKLREEYEKGIIDPEFATMNYDQYISKISTGRVLGMIDQKWDFQSGEDSIIQQGLDNCQYVPLGIVIDSGVREHYHQPDAIDVSNGVGITTSCKDIEGAMKFINDLLEPEIQTLRFWGIEGEHYAVGDGGVFYRTQDMRDKDKEEAYRNATRCSYSYLPFNSGMSHDGINAYDASHQPAEFYEGLSDDVKKCFEAYGVQTFVQMLQPSVENDPWYPMWSYSNALTADTADGEVWMKMGEVKHEYLPQVVMGQITWEEYLEKYNERCDIDTFLAGIDAEIQRRIDVANGNG